MVLPVSALETMVPSSDVRRIISLYQPGSSASVVQIRRVPSCAPTAPSDSAARKPRASPIPPAAITGTFTASTTCGTSGMVAIWPTWPPPSVPLATMASAPSASTRKA